VLGDEGVDALLASSELELVFVAGRRLWKP
jgi:hypothetical protein